MSTSIEAQDEYIATEEVNTSTGLSLSQSFDAIMREADKNPFEKSSETFATMPNEGSYKDGIARDVLEEKEHALHEPSQTGWFCENSDLPMRRRPHRVVLSHGGWPLSRVSSTKQFCGAIRDAANTQVQAYQASRQHGDISTDHTLISDEGTGIDWDLSIRLKPGIDQGAQTNWRTGTWQFISTARLLDRQSMRHERRDELESALHVFLYHSIRYQASKFSQEQFGDLQEALQTHFDSTRKTMEGRTYGGKGKLAYFRIEPPLAFDETQLENFLSIPHINLIETLRRLFIPLYISERSLRRFPDVVQSLDVALEVLKTSDRFIEILDKHLKMDGWKEDDTSDANDKLHGSDGHISKARGLGYAVRID